MKALTAPLAAAGIAVALSACAEPATLQAPASAIQVLLENPADPDPEDQEMNLNLYVLAQGLAEVVRDQEMRSFVLAEAAKEPGNEVRLSRLAAQNGRFASLLDSALTAQSRGSDGAGRLTLADIQDRMTYQGIPYFPNVYVPNVAVAAAGYAPIVAIGASVNGRDEIAGWDLRPGRTKPVFVSREAAESPGAAVMIVNHGADEVRASPFVAVGSAAHSPAATEPGRQTAASGQEFMWSQYQIKAGYHFEVKTAKADLAYLVSLFHTSGGYYFDFNSFPGVAAGLIDRISKSRSDNNTVFNSLKPFTGFLPQHALDDYPMMFVTVYEYDWWAGQKPIACGFLQHKPRMKYAHEWYIAACNIHVPTVFPNVDSTFVLSNWKGSFTIKRTE